MSSLRQPSSGKHAWIWGIILWLTHLSMLTPLLTITLWFAAIPAVVLYVKANRAVFGMIAAASMASAALLAGPLAYVFIGMAITMLIPAIVIGEGYRRMWKARKTLTAGVVTFLAIFLSSLVIATLLGGNMNEMLADMLRQGMSALPESASEMFNDEVMRQFIAMTMMMIPFYFIATSLFLTALTHGLARRILQASGEKIPGLPPVREWRVPRSFIWFYLIALFAEMFIGMDPASFLSTAVANIVPLFMIVFAVQGVAFLFFIGYHKQKSWVPVLGVIGAFFLPSAFSLLGVFDTAFPIRERFRKS